MAFTPKDWKDFPNQTTPLSAAAIEDVETRLSAYTDAREAAEIAARNAADTAAIASATGAAASAATTYTNSQISTLTSVTRGENADILGRWTPWLARNATIPPTSTPLILLPSGTTASLSANGKAGEGAFHFIASDYTMPSYNQKMRLRTTLVSNENTLPSNVTISVRAISAFTSAGSSSGTALSVNAPGGFTTWATHNSGQLTNVAHVATSAEFYAADMNVGGWTHFVIVIEAAGALSGTGALTVLTTLETRYVPA